MIWSFWALPSLTARTRVLDSKLEFGIALVGKISTGLAPSQFIGAEFVCLLAAYMI